MNPKLYSLPIEKQSRCHGEGFQKAAGILEKGISEEKPGGDM